MQTCGGRAASPSARALCSREHGKLQGKNTCGFHLILVSEKCDLKGRRMKGHKLYLTTVHRRELRAGKAQHTVSQQSSGKVARRNKAWSYGAMSCHLLEQEHKRVGDHDAGKEKAAQWRQRGTRSSGTRSRKTHNF